MPMAGGWDEMIFKSPPSQTSLWFYDNKEINCIFINILNIFKKKIPGKRNLTMSIQYRSIIILQQNHPGVNLTAVKSINLGGKNGICNGEPPLGSMEAQ